MTQNLQNIFKNLKDIEPPEELEGRILKAVTVKKAQAARRKLVHVRTGLVVSAGALIYVLAVFGKTFLESDFWSLVSLAFSDVNTVAQYWQTFSMSLLETFPVISTIAILAPIAALLLSLGAYLDLNNKHNYKYI